MTRSTMVAAALLWAASAVAENNYVRYFMFVGEPNAAAGARR
jgi:hypothetical protein